MKITAAAISLNVADVEATAAFATAHFGFTVEMESDGFVSLSRPDAGFNLIFLRLGLATFRPERLRGRAADGLLIVLVVDDIDGEYARLQAEGVEITTAIETEPWGERYFQVTDPHGVTVQFVQWMAEPAEAEPAEDVRPVAGAKMPIRIADAADALAVGRLLHAFNTEFGESTPDADLIGARAAPLIERGEVAVLFVGDGPDGFAEPRFRPSLYTVRSTPTFRSCMSCPSDAATASGDLLEAAMEHARSRGAAHIDLGTSENDVAARALYERTGFTNCEGGPDGPRMLYYERDL
ncbi:MAG: GNAT family N-acetyltransferase [Gaiellaceae bacterium MAG52_C11]|nr:GNAT family N-acetyltransferase [Candidatus Gaiellasilicea maunaloa]